MTFPKHPWPCHLDLPLAAWGCPVAAALVGCGSTGDGGVTEGGGGGVVDVEDCPAAELISDVAAVEGLVADETGAFWMDGGRVFRVDDVDREPRLLGDVGRELYTATGNRLTASQDHV